MRPKVLIDEGRSHHLGGLFRRSDSRYGAGGLLGIATLQQLG